MENLPATSAINTLNEILRKNVRSVDSVYRVGGDEFVILFPSTGLDMAGNAAKNCCTGYATKTWFMEKQRGQFQDNGQHRA